MSEDHTGRVRYLLSPCLLYEGLVESVQLSGLGCTVRVEHEDDTVSFSLDRRPTLLVLVAPAAVPELHLRLHQNTVKLETFQLRVCLSQLPLVLLIHIWAGHVSTSFNCTLSQVSESENRNL